MIEIIISCHSKNKTKQTKYATKIISNRNIIPSGLYIFIIYSCFTKIDKVRGVNSSENFISCVIQKKNKERHINIQETIE